MCIEPGSNPREIQQHSRVTLQFWFDEYSWSSRGRRREPGSWQQFEVLLLQIAWRSVAEKDSRQTLIWLISHWYPKLGNLFHNFNEHGHCSIFWVNPIDTDLHQYIFCCGSRLSIVAQVSLSLVTSTSSSWRLPRCRLNISSLQHVLGCTRVSSLLDVPDTPP